MSNAKGKIVGWGLFVLAIIVTFMVLIFLQSKKQIETPLPLPPAPGAIEVEIPTTPKVSKKPTIKTPATPKVEVIQNSSDTDNYRLGIENSDSFFCEKITDAALKQTCLDKIMVKNFRSSASKESCDSIKTESLKTDCLNNYYLINSIQELDEKGCDDIESTSTKERCIKTIEKNKVSIKFAKIEAESEPMTNEEILRDCDAFSGDAGKTCKDEINYKLAFEKKDLSYCNAIIDSVKQSQCIKTQSASINNYYLRQATTRKDPDLCNKILEENLRTACLIYSQ